LTGNDTVYEIVREHRNRVVATAYERRASAEVHERD